MITQKLILGDCLELMKEIHDKSIDMILCDLPYGCLNKHKSKWDNKIDFNNLWQEYSRIIKDSGVIALFGQGLFTAECIMSNKKYFRYTLVWDKVAKNGFLNANRMPLRQHEDIIIFYKKQPVYNPQMTKCEPHKRNHGKGKMLNHPVNNCYGNFVDLPTTVSDEKFPTTIISVSKEHCNGKFFHPTQKPVKLLEWLIKTYTQENELVLDNCFGSNSTGIACVNTNRNYIGIEKNEKYFQIGVDRVQKIVKENNIDCKVIVE